MSCLHLQCNLTWVFLDCGKKHKYLHKHENYAAVLAVLTIIFTTSQVCCWPLNQQATFLHTWQRLQKKQRLSNYDEALHAPALIPQLPSLVAVWFHFTLQKKKDFEPKALIRTSLNIPKSLMSSCRPGYQMASACHVHPAYSFWPF